MSNNKSTHSPVKQARWRGIQYGQHMSSIQKLWIRFHWHDLRQSSCIRLLIINTKSCKWRFRALSHVLKMPSWLRAWLLIAACHDSASSRSVFCTRKLWKKCWKKEEEDENEGWHTMDFLDAKCVLVHPVLQDQLFQVVKGLFVDCLWS